VGEIRDKVHVKEGDKFTMTVEKGVYEDTGKISVNYEGFVKDVNVGDIIVIDSGIVQAKAISKTDKDIEFQVIEGEVDMTTKRHINLHGRPVDLPTVTEQDWKDIDFGIEQRVDFIALSFVRTGDDVVRVRDHCRSKGVNIQVISKVENYESTENLEDIIRKSDGLMVARGDLSCEISFGQVPTIQKKNGRPLLVLQQTRHHRHSNGPQHGHQHPTDESRGERRGKRDFRGSRRDNDERRDDEELPPRFGDKNDGQDRERNRRFDLQSLRMERL
jgi:pyruvate kinase